MDATTKKANNSLAFLRQNISSCLQDIKEQCYTSLIRSVLEYTASAWDPHTTQCITHLEAVQRIEARFIMGDYRTANRTSHMIQNLGWQSLQQRRGDLKLAMACRITHDFMAILASMFFHPVTSSTRGHSLQNIPQY